MNGMKNEARNNRSPDSATEAKKSRLLKEGALGLLSAAVFVALFYLWGEEWLPRAAGTSGCFLSWER
jgi:hypothetical protein